jgi:Spy/CpxP family protein refolding chaperone
MINKKITYGILAVSTIAVVGLATTAYAGSKSGHFKHRFNKSGWTESVNNLGIDFDKLKEAMKSGQSMEEALEDQGVSYAHLLEQKKQAMVEKLDALVASGELTREEADEKLEYMSNYSFKKPGLKFHHKGFKSGHNKR